MIDPGAVLCGMLATLLGMAGYRFTVGWLIPNLRPWWARRRIIRRYRRELRARR